MENGAITLQNNLLKLREVFDCPDESLRDVEFMNTCKAIGIIEKQTILSKTRKKEDVIIPKTPLLLNYGPYDDPQIQMLRSMFPDVDISRLAVIYWDNGNDVAKATDSLLLKEQVYIPDEPSIELEYLTLKYSFIPTEQVTAIFIRSHNDYQKCESSLLEEYKETIRDKSFILQSFCKQYGHSKHRHVVDVHRQRIPHGNASPITEDDTEEPVKPSPISHIRAMSERRQAVDHLVNLRVMRNIRSEEARGYGKFLSGTLSQIATETQRYHSKNVESAKTLFSLHNGSHSLISLIDRGHSIDFHGLHVNEVEQYMNRIFEYARKNSFKKRITIITGAGNHSKNNVSPVRNYVRARLEREGITFHFEGGTVAFSC